MDLKLEGKKALVTGGSRGIGKAIARQLAREGVGCAICARGEDALRAAAAEIERETGSRVVPIVADTSRADGIQRLVEAAKQALGGIDILINNAARVAGQAPEDLAGVTDELMLRDFEERVLGYLRCARAVVPLMQSSGWGRVINVSGMAARVAGSFSAGARNAATVHLTKSLAVELGRSGINVNAIYPGTTVTERLHERLSARAARRGVTLEQAERQAAANVSIGRLVTAEEIGYVAAFLASPLSVAINGEVIAVSGGTGMAVYY
jgi:NAD(P)-dependent dehydrogenase (short-subunit alcohol dehydrogenase family)